jgi:hypothetical protein
LKLSNVNLGKKVQTVYFDVITTFEQNKSLLSGGTGFSQICLNSLATWTDLDACFGDINASGDVLGDFDATS